MICKECNGVGKIRLMPFNYVCTYVCTCAACNGKGETRDWLTNEEYIRSCSVEGLVDVIAEFYLLGYTHGHNGKDIKSRQEWIEWLKEIHE